MRTDGQEPATRTELRRIAKGGALALTGRLLDQAIGIAVGPVYARCLGVAGYGLYALARSVCEALRDSLTLGMPWSVARFVAISDGREEHGGAKSALVSGLRLSVAGTASAAALLFILAHRVASGVFHSRGLARLLRVMAPALPFTGAALVFASAGLGRRVVTPKVVGALANRVASLAVFLVLWRRGLGAEAAAWAVVVGGLVWLLASAILTSRIFPELRETGVGFASRASSLLAFGLPLAAGGLASFGLARANVLVLGARCTTAEAGIYNAALLVCTIGIFVPDALYQVFGPIVADLHAQGETERLQQLFQTVSRWAIAGALPLMLFAVAQRQGVLGILGAEFTAGTGALALMCAGAMAQVATGSGGWLLLMSGHQWLHLANDLAFAALNIGACWLVAPRYGAVGAAAAAAGVMGLGGLARLGQVCVLLRVQPYGLRVLKPVAVAVLGSLPFFLWEASGFVAVLVTAVAYAALVMCGYWLACLDVEERDILCAARDRALGI
ncbi:MAG: lipopolysaccharide biosynthesis protein [Armatimonadota bacterium]